ncbi:hypothetical protein FGL97_01260 [Pseudomonas putida]|nr:hypothetical protein [Pseudomonas putida]NVN66872.1 hypothetical protein [Pseudomonas putida]
MQPRQYAAEILQLRTRAKRNAALLQVPKAWQSLVRKHCEITWNHPSRHKLRESPKPDEQCRPTSAAPAART